jgi:hypothetical protein
MEKELDRINDNLEKMMKSPLYRWCLRQTRSYFSSHSSVLESISSDLQRKESRQ